MESVRSHPWRFVTIGTLSIIVGYLVFLKLVPTTQLQANSFTCPMQHECIGAECDCEKGACNGNCPHCNKAAQ